MSRTPAVAAGSRVSDFIGK